MNYNPSTLKLSLIQIKVTLGNWIERFYLRNLLWAPNLIFVKLRRCYSGTHIAFPPGESQGAAWMINSHRLLSQQHLLPVSLCALTGHLPLCLQNRASGGKSPHPHQLYHLLLIPYLLSLGFNNRAHRGQRKRHPHTILREYILTHLHEKQLAIIVCSHLMAIINPINPREDGNVDRVCAQGMLSKKYFQQQNLQVTKMSKTNVE